jgi:ubiquitin-protein ligase
LAFPPPQVKFQTKMYHPNIDDEGNICIGLLKTDAWKPATKMSTGEPSFATYSSFDLLRGT